MRKQAVNTQQVAVGLPAGAVEDIRREVMGELLRGEQVRLALIDSFLGRMDNLV